MHFPALRLTSLLAAVALLAPALASPLRVRQASSAAASPSSAPSGTASASASSAWSSTALASAASATPTASASSPPSGTDSSSSPASSSVTAASSAPASSSSSATSDGQCNVGSVQCCDSAGPADSEQARGVLGLLGFVLEDVVGLDPDALAGYGCSAGGASCTAMPMCCEDNEFDGLINLGCIPISIVL